MPLIQFSLDVLNNPEALSFKFSVIDFDVREGIVKINVTTSYRGRITLKDFKIVVMNKTLDFGDLRPGSDVSRILSVSMRDVKRLLSKGLTLEFSINGLYYVTITLPGGKYSE